MILFHADRPKQGHKENVSSSFLYSYILTCRLLMFLKQARQKIINVVICPIFNVEKSYFAIDKRPIIE
jgi:hypothetical protein